MNNFKLVKKEKIDSDMILNIYTHKSGIEIVFLKNSDDNRVFLPCFKTLGDDNKGIAHIVEHCILCGSKKFPIKDPFNELTKGTLNTYLNAITYRDKTIYPIASKVLKEFDKMFEVYIDGVFAPILKEEVFMLEGIRKDLEEKKYNGIVYNEMLSAYNDAESRLMENVFESLFPENSYRFNNAGEPSQIEKLTYSEFLAYYNKFYAKSNCTLYFYGDLDIDKYLEFIEENYLYTELENKNVNFIKQKPVINKISKKDSLLKELNYYAIGYVINENRELYRGYEINIAIDYLLSDDSSPLYKFLIEKYGLEEVTYDIDSQLYQNVFTIILKSKNKLNIEKVKKNINEFIVKHIEQGINYKGVGSQLNNFAFSVMEEDYGYKPKGLGYLLHLIEFWLYSDERNVDMLPTKLDIDIIRKDIKEGMLEKILYEEIIESKHNCTIELLASNNVSKKNDKILIDSEDIIKDGLLKKYLALDDSKEADRLIKTINPQDIPKNKIPDIKTKIAGETKVICVEPSNDKISYYTVNMEVGDLDFNILGLYIELFAQLSTKKNLIENLNMEIDNYIGDFQISFDSFIKDNKIFYYIIIEVKVLNEFIEKSIDLVFEILRESVFNELEIIKRKINETYNDFVETLENDNHELGINRCFSNFAYENKVSDEVEGIDFFNFIKKIREYDDKKLTEVINKVKNIKKIIENESDITFSVSSVKEKLFLDKIEKLKLSKNIIVTKNMDLYKKSLLNNKNERIKIQGNNNTNIMCGEILNKNHTGTWILLTNYVENDYLNKEIRIVGGAYSYGFEILRDNKFYIYSVNDPNIENTIKVFKNISDNIRWETITENEIKKCIVGTIGEIYSVKSKYDLFITVVMKYLRGISLEEEKKKIDEIINTTVTELNTAKDEIFSNIINETTVVIGSL